MELEFLLPFIGELKRLKCRGKPSKKNPIDRFYGSDLFDANVLSIISDFAQLTYQVSNYDMSQVGMTKEVNLHCGGKEVRVMVGREWYRDRPVCYAVDDCYINIFTMDKRNVIERTLLDGTYDHASSLDRFIIKRCLRRLLSDLLLFK